MAPLAACLTVVFACRSLSLLHNSFFGERNSFCSLVRCVACRELTTEVPWILCHDIFPCTDVNNASGKYE